MKRWMSFFGWLLGEGAIVYGFMHFGIHSNHDVVILNTIVSSIVWASLFVESLFPMRNLDKHGNKRNGRLGLRLFFNIVYAGLSIVGMLYFGFLNHSDLITQVIVHLIFFCILTLGMWTSYKSSDDAESDPNMERMERNQLTMIRNSLNRARTKAELRRDVPTDLLEGIKDLYQKSNSLQPGREKSALSMETNIMLEVNNLNKCLDKQHLDDKWARDLVRSCSKMMNGHRQTFQAS